MPPRCSSAGSAGFRTRAGPAADFVGRVELRGRTAPSRSSSPPGADGFLHRFLGGARARAPSRDLQGVESRRRRRARRGPGLPPGGPRRDRTPTGWWRISIRRRPSASSSSWASPAAATAADRHEVPAGPAVADRHRRGSWDSGPARSRRIGRGSSGSARSAGSWPTRRNASSCSAGRARRCGSWRRSRRTGGRAPLRSTSGPAGTGRCPTGPLGRLAPPSGSTRAPRSCESRQKEACDE